MAYVKPSLLRIRQEPKDGAESLGVAPKTAAVQILESARDKFGVEWRRVRFLDEFAEVTGWARASDLVDDRLLALPERFRALDFKPQQKTFEYPGNPRVKTRGIYVTRYSASGSHLNNLLELTSTSAINAFVIDVKDDGGAMLFKSATAEKYSPAANKGAPIKDVAAFMRRLKDYGVYAIARIVAFKDPIYSKQHPEKAIIYRDTGKPLANRDGLIWATAHDRELWAYNVGVAKEAARAGFNEIQFDYVRFPASDGGKLDSRLDYRNPTRETKSEAIQKFLKYARQELAPLRVYIAADVYGLVATTEDDMSLGQYWEAISNVVDYICPMMYPSHYWEKTYGFAVPDAHPYGTVSRSARDAVMRSRNLETPATIRAWIQYFTASWVKGHIRYSEKEVAEQVRALKDHGIDEYMLWNPSNKYPKTVAPRETPPGTGRLAAREENEE